MKTGGKKVRLKVTRFTFEQVNKHRRRGNKLSPKWWIEGLPWEECQRVRCGPYESYQEALSDKDGMQKIFDNEDHV